jgi:hypothetical protein
MCTSSLRSEIVESHLRYELVDKDDNTNRADETAEEGSRKNTVQKSQSTEPSCEDNRPC